MNESASVPPDRTPGKPEISESFTASFGSDPSALWSAPGRVNLIGEHVDYNGGPVLPFAIQHRCYVAGATNDDGVIRLRSKQFPNEAVSVALADLATGAAYSHTREVPAQRFGGWASYVLGVIWALGQVGVSVPPVDVLVDGRVPVGAGLSSSAALECAAVGAFCDIAGADIDGPQRATIAQRAENDFVGVPCGLMDQMASTCAHADHALLFDSYDQRSEQIPLGASAAGYEFLVVDTGAAHGLVDGEYARRRSECEEAARALGVKLLREVTDRGPQESVTLVSSIGDGTLRRRARHVVSEIQRVELAVDALKVGDWPRLGALMTASHNSLRDDFEVSSPQLDAAVEGLLSAGSLGARLTGAGFGGSVVALIEASKVDTAISVVRTSFAAAGFKAPTASLAVASQGARREPPAR
ncbi:MAG: galactokinase [Acidimicrobiales bacterium]